MQTQPQTDFAIIPTRDEIASVERDIRFFPAVTTAPRSLSPEQVRAWNADGYLAPLDVLNPEEATEYRVYFDDLLAQALAAGRDSYSISSAHMKHARVWDLLNHPRIVGPVRDLLGEDVIGWGAHFFCKMPGDGKSVEWHQDCSYWPLTPTKAITAWLAIDDADLENGCMEVAVGSHTRGLIEFETTGADSGNVLDQAVKNPERYGRMVATPLIAGQMSLHSDLLLHGSLPNNSQRRRCGLTLRYCPADVNAYLGWNQKGVVVSGDADPTRWPGLPRPLTA
jgi:non-heme Fe2+,alpha-ketoglutarate-dependent halogenase